MNHADKFIVGVYGRMQIEMIATELLNNDGSPKPTKHMNHHERDAIAIYDHLSYLIRKISKEKLNDMAKYTNEVAKKLINDDTLINNYLLSMMLYRLYLQDVASKYEKDMILPKVERQIKLFEGFEGESYKRTRKTTARVADNMWRVFTEKAQLSDEIRDLRRNKLIKISN